MELLLGGSAEALINMPLLEDADLFTYLSWDPNDRRKEEYPEYEKTIRFRWGVRYILGDTHRLEWQVGKWRPSTELHQLFHDFVRSRQDGKPLEERWIACELNV